MNFIIKIIKKFKIKILNFFRKNSPTYYLSVGENCLADNILSRYELKSFSTPYSHGRSNLDYAISLEKENYKNLLNKKYLYYETLAQSKVVRNRYYSFSDDIYSKLHQNGFEFTHHDVISDKSEIESYKRKIFRMISLSHTKRVKFIYHYRHSKKKDISALAQKAKEFLQFYDLRGAHKSEFIFFTQEIVKNYKERNIIKVYDTSSIKGYVLHTMNVWEGDDENILWAKNDDDLLSRLIEEIK